MTTAPPVAGLGLRISVTDRCSLRCLYCRPQPLDQVGRPAELLQAADLLRFVRVAQHALGVAKLRLTGGEPLDRGDLVELVAALAPLDLPDLALTTNGQRLAPLALPLRKAGLDRINVSLDSLDARTFKRMARGGDLARTLAGIEAARACGLTSVRINMAVLRGINDHEAETMVAYALERGCELRFIELMPAGLSAADYARWYLPSAELHARLATHWHLVPQAHTPGESSRRFRVDGSGLTGVLGFISPNSHPFCSGCRRLRLTADGRLLGCLGRREHIGLLGLLRTSDANADERIAAAMHVALACKRGAGPFTVTMPMSSVGG